MEFTIQIQVDMVGGNRIQGYQEGVSMDLATLKDPSDLKDLHLSIGIASSKGFKAVGEVLWFTWFSNPPRINRFYENYINSNGIAYGYG